MSEPRYAVYMARDTFEQARALGRQLIKGNKNLPCNVREILGEKDGNIVLGRAEGYVYTDNLPVKIRKRGIHVTIADDEGWFA